VVFDVDDLDDVTALLAATPGVGVDPIEQAVSLPPEAAGSELGAAVLAAVGGSARIVPHPSKTNGSSGGFRHTARCGRHGWAAGAHSARVPSWSRSAEWMT
jgi:hypothetical protein